MSKIPSTRQLSSKHFAAEPLQHGHTYQRMLSLGHHLRPGAGKMLEAMDAAAKRKEISMGAITRILEAAEDELVGSGNEIDVLAYDFTFFYHEFGHLFTDEAVEKLRDIFPNMPPRIGLGDDAPGLRKAMANGWFHEIAADGVVDLHEAEVLATASFSQESQTLERNLQKLYGSEALKFEPGARARIREGRHDPEWMQIADSDRYVKAAFERGGANDKEIRKLGEQLRKRFPNEWRTPIGERLEATLERVGLPKREDLNLTAAGRRALDEFLDGAPAIDRIIDSLDAGFSDGMLNELATALRWTYPYHAGNDAPEIIARIDAKLGHHYGTHPDIDVDTCYALDLALRGQEVAQKRRRAAISDLFGALDVIGQWYITGEATIEHPQTGKDVKVSSTHAQITVQGYAEDGSDLVIGTNQDSLIMKQKGDSKAACSEKELGHMLEDEDLADVVRSYLCEQI